LRYICVNSDAVTAFLLTVGRGYFRLPEAVYSDCLS